MLISMYCLYLQAGRVNRVTDYPSSEPPETLKNLNVLTCGSGQFGLYGLCGSMLSLCSTFYVFLPSSLVFFFLKKSLIFFFRFNVIQDFLLFIVSSFHVVTCIEHVLEVGEYCFVVKCCVKSLVSHSITWCVSEFFLTNSYYLLICS